MTTSSLKSSFRSIMFFGLLIFGQLAWAQIQWREPQVLGKELDRDNRKVLRFSGNTSPGAQVRIKKNQVKLYLEDGNARMANLTQKDKPQFPVTADDNGDFAFELYLPTGAVEIPVETYAGERWVPYNLNIRVPEEGEDAEGFEATELDEGKDYENFDAESTIEDRLQRGDSSYRREEDQGQVIRRRDKDSFLEKHDFRFFLGMGMNYINLTENAKNAPVDLSQGLDVNESAFKFPSWRLGAYYRHDEKWKFDIDFRSTSVNLDPGSVPAIVKNIGDKEWSILKLSTTRMVWETNWGPLGIDGGLQFHSVPYLKLQPGFSTYSYYDLSMMFLAIGAKLESWRERRLPWEAYARLLYGINSSSEADVGTALAFDMGGGVTYDIIPSFTLGLFGEFQYHFYSTKFSNYDNDYTLAMFAVDGRLIIRF